MRSEKVVLVALKGSQIAFVGDTRSHGELPSLMLGRNQSLIESTLTLASDIGCVSHSSLKYYGKYDNSHVFWTIVDDCVEIEDVHWASKEQVMMTEMLRKFLSRIQEVGVVAV